MVQMRWKVITLEDDPQYGDVFTPPDRWLRLQYREAGGQFPAEIIGQMKWKDVPVEKEGE